MTPTEEIHVKMMKRFEYRRKRDKAKRISAVLWFIGIVVFFFATFKPIAFVLCAIPLAGIFLILAFDITVNFIQKFIE